MSAGTAHYSKIPDADLTAIPGSVDRIAECFIQQGYERAAPEIAHNPTANELRDALSRIFARAEPDDTIVFYYTGHGVTKGRFYLLATDSEEERLSGTALGADELVHMVLESAVNQVLLILDTCYAGKGVANLVEVASRYENEHRWNRNHSGFHFIASAWSKEEAKQGAFAAAFVEMIRTPTRRIGGRTQEYLQPSAIVSALNERPEVGQGYQHAVYDSFNVSVESQIIKNPRYDCNALVDIETTSYWNPGRDLDEHFVRRARGTDLSSEAWYFTGRECARRRLVHWLALPNSEGRPCIVTGSPGTGKSALLGWLVALSDPQKRAAIERATGGKALNSGLTPAAGSINLALHVRGKNAAEVVRAIGDSIVVDVDGPSALVDALKQRRENFALVVDALDEASDVRGITRLLGDLAPLQHLRIIVGTRPNQYNENAVPRYTALGRRITEIDLDDPRYLGAKDIARYVERRLLAEDEPSRQTPYRGKPEQARIAAAAVARRAGGVFLIAYILSRHLMEADSPMDVTGPKWYEATAIHEAFREDLERFDQLPGPTGLNKRSVSDLLCPLAFAEGRGLPWETIWATLATAISGKTYTDSDIDALLDHAGAYIVETLERGSSVYRLYHQALAEYFRLGKGREFEIQRRIVDALGTSITRASSTGGPDWESLSSYIVAHYPAHAAASGQKNKLKQVLLDAAFVTRKLELTDVYALLADYGRFSDDADLRLIQDAMRLSAHVLARDPTQFASQLIGRLLPSAETPAVRDFIDSLVKSRRKPWLRPLFPALRPPGTGLLRILEGHVDWINAVALTSDGRWAVSGSNDQTLKVWDLGSGRVLQTLAGHAGPVTAVAFTPDGLCAVSGSDDHTLKVWDIENGRVLRTLQGHDGSVNSVALTADGRRAVSGSADKTLMVWNLDSGAALHTFKGHAGSIYAVALTPDGRRVVSGSNDQTLKVWDIETGSVVRTLRGHAGSVNAVALTPDGRRAVSGSDDRTLKIWDIESGRLAQTLDVQGHTEWIDAVALTPDGFCAISGSADRTLKIWNLESGRVLRTLEGHPGSINTVAVTPDGHRVVSGSEDATLKVWDLESGRMLESIEGHVECVTAVAFTTDSRCAVSASADNTLKVWDLGSGHVLRTFEGHVGSVNSLALTSDGRRAVSGSDDKTLRVWDLESGQIWQTLEGHARSVNAVALTSDGRAVSGSDDMTLRVWDLGSGRLLQTIEGHARWINALALTPDGRCAVSSFANMPVRILDLGNGRLLQTLEGHTGCINALAVTPDGRFAVSGSDDRSLKVWDLESGRVVQTLVGHAGSVTAVVVTPDGRCVVSGSSDKSLRIWDLESGLTVATFSCDYSVECCAVANDWTIVAGDGGGQVHFLALER